MHLLFCFDLFCLVGLFLSSFLFQFKFMTNVQYYLKKCSLLRARRVLSLCDIIMYELMPFWFWTDNFLCKQMNQYLQSSASFSTTASLRLGCLQISSWAVAKPTIPPPTMHTSKSLLGGDLEGLWRYLLQTINIIEMINLRITLRMDVSGHLFYNP